MCLGDGSVHREVDEVGRKRSVVTALLKLRLRTGSVHSEVYEVRIKWFVAIVLDAWLNLMTQCHS